MAQMAQAAHAAVELVGGATEAARRWRRDSNTVVIVQLLQRKLAELAKVKGARSFREPDMKTPFSLPWLLSPQTKRLIIRSSPSPRF